MERVNWFKNTADVIESETTRLGYLTLNHVIVALPAREVIVSEGNPVFGRVLARLVGSGRIDVVGLPEEIGLVKARKMASEMMSGQRRSPFF